MPDPTPPTLEYGIDPTPGGFTRGCAKRTAFILAIVILFYAALMLFGMYYPLPKKQAPANTTAPATSGVYRPTNGSSTGHDYNPPMPPIHPQTRIGHIHLKVADINRSLAFYQGVLGFEITQRYGQSAVFLSAGGYHHHIAINTWESAGGQPPAPGTTGLFHLAILYPTRAALADALRRLLAANIELDGASDHGVSQALYLRDPDQNGVELYWDRPEAEWPRTAAGELNMFTRALDLRDLLAAAPGSDVLP